MNKPASYFGRLRRARKVRKGTAPPDRKGSERLLERTEHPVEPTGTRD